MNPDNKIMNFLSSLGDLFLLNILYLVCCIPIVTIGAATTALYSITLKMAENREPSAVWREFLRVFRENFKQATIIWLILLAVAAVLLANGVLVGAMSESLGALVSLTSMIVAVFLTLTAVYVFAVLARFDNSVLRIMKVSLLMAIRHLPWTVVIVAIHCVPLLLLLVSLEAFLQGVGVVLLFTVSVLAYLESKIFARIFPDYYPK